MKICLKTQSKQDGTRRVVIKLQERLPERISAPCELTCDFHVESFGDYYLLVLNTAGALAVQCQRCMNVFHDDYSNQSKLAVCANDSVAEALMDHFECIVSGDSEVDLVDILSDELHLFSPEKHDDSTDCDVAVSRLIGGIDSQNHNLCL